MLRPTLHWWICVALALLIAPLVREFASAQTTVDHQSNAIDPDAVAPTTDGKVPAVERANSESMFMAAAEMVRKKRLEDAGYFFYVAQLRARIDLDCYEPLEPDDGGNGPGLAIAAVRMRLGEIINPALMRDRDAFGRAIDRVEKWSPAYSPGYSPGWKFKHEVSEAEFKAGAQETKSRWLGQMREYNRLLQNDEYYHLFCLVQEYNFQDLEHNPWEMFGGSQESRHRVSKKESQTAESRLKQIEQDHKVEYGMFGGGSMAKRPRKPHYTVLGTEVTYKGRPVAGADATSFEILSDVDFAKDANSVYVLGYPIDGTDPKSFRVIRSPYSRDNHRVYCGNVPMDGVKLDSFEVVRDCSTWEGIFIKESFIQDFGAAFEAVEVSDKSPAVVGHAWARDGQSYYFGPARVDGADYETFQVVDDSTAKDKNHEYRGSRRDDSASQPLPAKFP
jgi:hypothetical protein